MQKNPDYAKIIETLIFISYNMVKGSDFTMITFFSHVIADFLYQKKVISKDYIDICAYGYEVFFFNLFNALLILLFGILLDKLLYSIVFFLIFAVLRQYCGGFHAKSTIVCTIAYLLSYLFVIIISTTKAIIEMYTFPFCIIFNLTFIIMIFLYAPIENINKPLESHEKIRNKKKSLLLSAVASILSCITFFIDIHMSAIIILTFFVIMIMMFIGTYIRKEDEIGEKAS